MVWFESQSASLTNGDPDSCIKILVWCSVIVIQVLKPSLVIGEMAGKSEQLEEVVLSWLGQQDADILEGVCAMLDITVPERKKGKRGALYKLLVIQLNSLEEDEDESKSFAVIEEIANFMKTLISKESVSPDEKGQDVSLGSKTKTPVSWEDDPGRTKTKVIDVLKMKDLKISGVIGGSSEKDKLSFSSLLYQIKNAQERGYSEENICNAVVNAISHTNNLRVYLESKPKLDIKSLTEILKSHFKEKDSATVFTELGNAVQKKDENALDFVIRLMCLRQKVFDLGKEEGCLYSNNMIQKILFHSMWTGLTNANIRVELRERCQGNFEIGDTELLQCVSEVMANEQKRIEKSSLKVSVNANEYVPVGVNSDKKKVPKENPFDELKATHQKEKAEQQKQLSSLQDQITEIKNLLLSKAGNPSESGLDKNENRSVPYIPPHRRNQRYFRCEKCDRENSFRCFHCFVCGSADHKIADCPNKEKNE